MWNITPKAMTAPRTSAPTMLRVITAMLTVALLSWIPTVPTS